MKRKIELNVPTEVLDIRLGQFQEYLKLVEGIGEDAVINEFVKMKMISIFCDIPLELIRETFSANHVNDLYTDIRKILDELTEDVNEDKPFNPRFKYGNTEFGFMNDLDGMMAGEYADLTDNFDGWDKIHKAMAVLWRPIIKVKKNSVLDIEQYEIAEYKGTNEYGELMKMMPAKHAIAASFFLTSSFIKLQNYFLHSLEKRMEKNPEISTTWKANSQTIGDGIKAFTQSLDKISLKSKKW